MNGLDAICSTGCLSESVSDATADDLSTGRQQAVNPRLLASLQKWRLRRSAEAGLPAYCILHNTTMEEISRRRPDTLRQLDALKGMGPKRIEQYGKELLAIIAETQRSEEADDSVDTDVAGEATASPIITDPSLSSHDERPSYFWTWRLLVAGFTSAECAAIRGLDCHVIVDHALQAVENGHPVQSEWFFSEEQLSRFRAVVGQSGPDEITRLLPSLPRGTRLEEVLLFLKCRR